MGVTIVGAISYRSCEEGHHFLFQRYKKLSFSQKIKLSSDYLFEHKADNESKRTQKGL
ncbi:hypothetical protein ABIB40_001246 [Pedobacter sp. UYP30]